MCRRYIALVADTALRILGQHSWRPSRFNCIQMKIVYKYNLVPKFDFICFPYK